MNVTVFGANGRVGSLAVQQLLARGHEVTAFVHGKSRLGQHARLHVINGDIYNEASVSEALNNADAIVSALGSWGTKTKDVLSEGMKRIIPIAEAMGVTRVVSLTGADARAAGDKVTLLHRLSHAVFSVTAGAVLVDGEQHIRLLAASSLRWTVVRSPVMKSDDTQTYGLNMARPLPWQTIPRSAVVQCLCDLVESSEHIGDAPYIHRG